MLVITTFVSTRLNRSEIVLTPMPDDVPYEAIKTIMDEYLTGIGHDATDRMVYDDVNMVRKDTLCVAAVSQDSLEKLFNGNPMVKEAYKIGKSSH